MILAIHSDASYLSESKACIRVGGHFFLSNNEKFPSNNGAICNIMKVIRAVMTLAAKAQLGTLFINVKQVVAIQVALTEMGHLQSSMPNHMNNSTAMDVITNTILPKATKAKDKQFNRLWD